MNVKVHRPDYNAYSFICQSHINFWPLFALKHLADRHVPEMQIPEKFKYGPNGFIDEVLPGFLTVHLHRTSPDELHSADMLPRLQTHLPLPAESLEYLPPACVHSVSSFSWLRQT
jgi:hypothetical protein